MQHECKYDTYLIDIQLLTNLGHQMLFTWDTKNLCIVFRQWHIRSTPSLIISLLAVVLIGIGYEGLRSLSRSYENTVAQRLESMPSKFFFIVFFCLMKR